MNKPISIRLDTEKRLSDLELLEQIYKKVRIGEKVKFRGKAYLRIRPKNSKECKHPYYFRCVSEDIYAGSFLLEDGDGEDVNIMCEYSVV